MWMVSHDFDVNIKCAVGTNTYWIVPRLGKLMSELSTGFIEQYRIRVLTQLKCEIIARIRGDSDVH